MVVNKFREFRDNHPIIFNALLIAFVFFILCYSALLAIDIFTAHGHEKRVPDVRQLSLEQAAEKLSAAGFKWTVSDSVHYEQYSPGAVIDQEPKGNSSVKALRTVYLTINGLQPEMKEFPDVMEVSVRQAMSMLQARGFKNIRVDTIAHEYEELIVKITVNNHGVRPGELIAVNAPIKLTMGDGSIGDLNPMDMEMPGTDSVPQGVAALPEETETN